MQNTNDRIFFNFSYFALKLLGKGMYSNPWTAIAELVANGLDAKAKNIKILIDMSSKTSSTIEIFDDGYGMGYDDLAEKYVLIGKNKREDSQLDENTKKELMGRKGIGKLAALYLSNKFYLISKTVSEESAWCLDMTASDESDIPRLDRINTDLIDIKSKKAWSEFKTGTMIKLINVDLTNIGVQTIEGLKARLADFYLLDALKGTIDIAILNSQNQAISFSSVKKSIAFKNMYALYDNTNKYYSKLSKTVYFYSNVPSIDNIKREVKIIDVSSFENTKGQRKFLKENGILTEHEITYEMVGWIGIHTSIQKADAERNDPEYLRNKAYRPNQLRLYVRNKLAVENFLDYIKNTQAFGNYIEGEIRFDILDNDELGDIATSNRQGFIEDDERVQLLINILKPIINNLIGLRSKMGTQINNEEKAYYENQRAEEERAKKEAEEQRNQAERQALELGEKLEIVSSELGSEKKRNSFLFESLSTEQIDFAKRLHMIKINLGTIRSVVTKLLMKKNRKSLNEKEIWASIKTISYCAERMKALLEYGANAKFNTKEEIISGDMFQFISEYCENVLNRYAEIKIAPIIKNNANFSKDFSPQNIAVILENIVSNSLKHKAKKIAIEMYIIDTVYYIDFIDDGNGLEESQKENSDELFEFGKGYTKTGSGVGLYHVKSIINDMHGSIKINTHKPKKNGFELQVRFPNEK